MRSHEEELRVQCPAVRTAHRGGLPQGHRGRHDGLHVVTGAPAVSADELRGSLLSTIDLLYRRRAAEVGDRLIDGYIALDWLEWNGGTLRLTATGENVRRQLVAGLEPT
jgi:hypothetical protein